MKWVWTLLVGSILLGLEARGADPELRACWISRFEWPHSNEATCKARISNMMQTLKANNFNAVLFQLRGDCSTLYPSPYEPWASQFGWSNPGWDPAAYAIEQAHANGLEFHAYINTHTISSTIPPNPTVPQHVYHLHGAAGTEPNWQIHNSSGQPAGLTDSYYWLAPGVPEAEAWTRRAIVHVVQTYDVDGVHFDRIRCPGSDYSYDPISLARFAGDGNPDGLAWGDWMRSQITRQLRNIYGAVNQVKPKVKITAAPFGICMKVPDGYQGTGTQSYYSWYQDSFGWMQSRVVDAIFPMIYWDIGSAHPFEVLLADFLNRAYGRHVYPGSTSGRDYIAQVYEARRQGAPGQTVFSYNSINFSSYLSGPYSEPAAIPEMPWKTNPTTGIVVGYVTDISDNPVVDARINRTGDSYNYLSSADGFYTILEIPSGTFHLSAQKAGLGQASASGTLAAGQVLEINLKLRTSMGTVQTDKAVYHIGETISVLLNDSDLAGQPSATAEVHSTSEPSPEVLTLTALGESGGFEGTIALAAGNPARDGVLQVSPGDTITLTYRDANDGSGPAIATAEASVDPRIVVYDEPLDSDPEWTAQGQWAYGIPMGQAGDHGQPDPTSGFTGTSVYGYNLSGGYANDMPAAEYLTSPPIDCSGGYSTLLTFYRWLNVEQNAYDHASVQVSNNGLNWHTLWENPDVTLEEAAWSLQQMDLARYADHRPSIQIRWGMGPTDGGWTYSGWNIDDVRVLQIPGGKVQFIIDNDEPGFSFSGTWNTSSFGSPYGPNKRYAANGDGSGTAIWEFTGIPAGEYTLEFWVNDNNYAADAHYRIEYDGAPSGGAPVTASQNYQGDGWHTLGQYAFTGGTARITLIDSWQGEGVYIVADALRLTFAGSMNGASGWSFY